MASPHPRFLRWRPLAGRELPLLAALFFLLALVTAGYVFWLPDVSVLRTKNPKVTSYMLIGELRARAAGKKFRRVMIWRDLDRISPNLRNAVVASEDDNFYQHSGIDWDSTLEALRTDWEEKRLARGGSTITQQLARNLYLSPSKNPFRKLKEMLIAKRLEKELGKRRILELYLNVVEWGRGIYGAEAASRTYFGKPASGLTPEEAAALAAVLPSPRRYDPVGGTRFMERQKRRIIARMRADGYLPEGYGEDAGAQPAVSTAALAGAPVQAPASTGPAAGSGGGFSAPR